jgi:hypothetical protein
MVLICSIFSDGATFEEKGHKDVSVNLGTRMSAPTQHPAVSYLLE